MFYKTSHFCFILILIIQTLFKSTTEIVRYFLCRFVTSIIESLILCEEKTVKDSHTRNSELYAKTFESALVGCVINYKAVNFQLYSFTTIDIAGQFNKFCTIQTYIAKSVEKSELRVVSDVIQQFLIIIKQNVGHSSYRIFDKHPSEKLIAQKHNSWDNLFDRKRDLIVFGWWEDFVSQEHDCNNLHTLQTQFSQF